MRSLGPSQSRKLLRSHPLIARIALALISAGLVVSCLEIGFRSMAYFAGNSGRLDELEFDSHPAVPPEKRGKRRHQIKLSANPRIVYEHRSNFSRTDELGNVFTINESGFRGPTYSTTKGPSAIRIVGLGDSVMYGNGVSDDDIFMARLSRKLNDAYPDASWEIINTAVGGYNTVMEVETLKEKGLAYQPDLVLILFVGNDLNLPNFIRKPISFFAPHSFLIDWVRGRVGRLPRASLVPAPTSEEGNWFEGDPDKVPAAYRHMVGPEAYRNAMHELKSLSVENDFELIVFQQYYRTIVTETCAELDLSLVHFQPAVDLYMRQNGIEQFRGSELSVSQTDPHPSAKGHQIYADVIFDYLESAGAVDRARSRLAGERR